MRFRLLLGTAGLALLGFGVFRILDDQSRTDPRGLVRWLVGYVLLHDGVIVPVTMLVGVALTKFVPPRARRYLQGALVAAALVTLVSIPIIYKRGSQPAAKSLENQDYGLHLAWLLVLIGSVTLVAYLVRVVRDGRAAGRNERKLRPRQDQDSSTRRPASAP